jgi:antitoxin (DNA-binding transcriptional repressor) of toxin-antitoxin stability system
MKQISISEARRRISEIITMVERGDEFVVLRQGCPIAKISRIERSNFGFPDMSAFRAEIGASADGEPLSETIIQMRRGARY